MAAFMEALAPLVDHWCLASLDTERGFSATELRQMLPVAANTAHEFPSAAAACQYAQTRAAAGDRVVVCGSFITVAEAMSCHV